MPRYRTNLMICTGTGCVSNGAFRIKDVLEQELAKQNLQDEVQVVTTGCNGFCANGPIVVVQPEGIFYQMLTGRLPFRATELETLLREAPQNVEYRLLYARALYESGRAGSAVPGPPSTQAMFGSSGSKPGTVLPCPGSLSSSTEPP